MGIVNRSLDSTEQYQLYNTNIRETTTGESDVLVHLPYPVTAVSAKLNAVTLSGTPTCQLQIQRFVTGAGATLIPLGAALTMVAASTSGPQSYTFSSTALQAGDKIVATHAGTNAALAQLNIALVLQATQDIKSWDF